jgi:hypothetical protein
LRGTPDDVKKHLVHRHADDHDGDADDEPDGRMHGP